MVLLYLLPVHSLIHKATDILLHTMHTRLLYSKKTKFFTYNNVYDRQNVYFAFELTVARQ